MKKILLVCTSNIALNGVTSVIMNYVKRTYKDVSYDFLLCNKVDPDLLGELEKMGEDVYMPPFSRVKHPIKYYVWLKRFLRGKKYDCLHIHGNSAIMYIEIRAAKIVGIETRIAHCHSSNTTSMAYRILHKLLKRKLNRAITHAIACSDVAGKWIFTRKYEVLANGIDVRRFMFSQETRDRYRRLLNFEDKLVVGHVGYMETVKNHVFLLNVARKITETNKKVCFLLVGDGSLRGDIEKHILEYNLSEFVTMVGKRSDVAELYQCMDAFVLPSLYEGLPVTMIEAQASGLPCIISDKVTREACLTDQVEYLGIDDSDHDKWCELILKISSDSQKRVDKNRIIALSKFNIDSNVETLLSLYQI